MAAPNTRGFTALVRGQVAAIQAAAAGLLDFTTGAVLLAVSESIAAVVLWLQALILALLATMRAATSQGADLDSWMADFGLTRLPAHVAVGTVTFGRFSSTQQTVVPIGATVQSADGTQTYQVIADTTNAAYNFGLGGYVMAIGIGSVNVPVQALVSGAAGNAVAGAVTVITSAITGVDTVTNASPFAQGADPETDAALRLRFITFLASLSKATSAAIENAVDSLQQGAVAKIVENLDYTTGATKLGYFYVVVDDGSGAPSSDFVAAAAAAVDRVRGLSIRFDVFPPVVITANVSMVLTVAAGYVKATVAATVQAALTAYINGLGLGVPLNFTKLAQIAYEASPGVTNVSSVLLNAGTADLAATFKQVIKAGTIAPTAP